MAAADYDKMLFERAATMLRVQGIISIVFGGLGVLCGLLIMLAFGVGAMAEYTAHSAIGSVIFGLMVFIFFVLPHLYLVIAGTTLLRQPQPSVARTLTIINLVVGVFWNLIVLIFAIISLTQSGDYERHYPKKKEK